MASKLQEAGKPLRQLESYVNSLEERIQGAKWKQATILKYNYMPLESAKQKLEEETARHLAKMQALSYQLEIQTQSRDVEVQVDQFRAFATKLLTKIADLEHQMKILKMDMAVLRASVQQKRQSFQTLMKTNANLTKLIIADTAKLDKVQPGSVRKREDPNYIGKIPQISKKAYQEEPGEQLKEAGKTIKFQSLVRDWTVELYEECVESIARSLKNMRTSEDVQTGIYLEIMNRKTHQKSPTFSLKSKTCDVLLDRYKDLKTKREKQNDDFLMGLDSFLELNWKQIMGVILVKDRSAGRLKGLLQASRESYS